MPPRAKKQAEPLGFEETLWKAADPRRLGQLVDLVSGIGLGSDEHREKDILGRVYEYFLGRFASAEGKNSGEFYTPRSTPGNG